MVSRRGQRNNYFAANQRMMRALGIRGIFWKRNSGDRSIWDVELEDKTVLQVETRALGTQRTVIRLAAERLAQMGRPVKYVG